MKSFLIAFILSIYFFAANAQTSAFVVHLDSSVKKALNGRLYLFSTTDTSRTVSDPDPFNPSPSFYKDVQNWKGGQMVMMDSAVAAFPLKMNKLRNGFYKFAVVFDIDTLQRNNTITAGNWYSKDVKVEVRDGAFPETHLYLSKQIPERPFRETQFVKQLIVKSSLVTGFRKKDSYIKAGVLLPAGYFTESAKIYPVVFIIPGWGGTHYDVQNPNAQKRYGMGTGKEKIYVYLNPETDNPFGLHAFIDSRVNGPWGKALVEELVPLLQSKFRADKNSNHYFVVGQSSGGYAALWLQLHYPKAFGGCWAVSPDPVDFSDFTSVNLYAKNANMYYDETGKERPFFFMNNQYLSTIKGFASFEHFLGDGGQMQSFEGAFGVPDKTTKKPQQLFNRETGVINPAVLNRWKQYDLAKFVQANYAKYKAALAGKIHVYAGADDNFFLNRSVKLFAEKCKQLNAAVVAEEIPGANHFSIWNENFTKRVQAEMDASIAN
jgi:S-formylglutathione hydrolase FrmB